MLHAAEKAKVEGQAALSALRVALEPEWVRPAKETKAVEEDGKAKLCAVKGNIDNLNQMIELAKTWAAQAK